MTKSNAISGSEASTEPVPLKIVIVGAGIAGLTAAIGLRRQGHEVHVRLLFGAFSVAGIK